MSPAALLEEMVLPVQSLKKFGRRLDTQLARLERKIRRSMPQLARRGAARREAKRRSR
jgi:hypothetical protein